jgi:hypothetical protein
VYTTGNEGVTPYFLILYLERVLLDGFYCAGIRMV